VLAKFEGVQLTKAPRLESGAIDAEERFAAFATNALRPRRLELVDSFSAVTVVSAAKISCAWIS